MKITSTLTFYFSSSENATIFYRSFTPELADLPMKRSELKITHYQPEDSHITFEITADDAIGYRATMNSLIQAAHIVEQTINFVEG